MTRRIPGPIGPISAAVLLAVAIGQAQAPQAPAGGGRGGNANLTNAALWTAFDADQDGSTTRAEMKGAFEKWYDATDTAKAGSVTTDQLGAALNTALGLPAPAAPAAGGGWSAAADAVRAHRPRRRLRHAAAAATSPPSDRRPARTTWRR